VDVHDRLNQLTAMVHSAKAMPMSASCLVNRVELLEQLQRLREELPANLDHAEALLSEREAVLTAAREEAERILEGARTEREQLIQQTDVLVTARARAAAVTTQARGESTQLLGDADDYVDRKLSEFEVLLGQLASQVNNGRLRLTVRREADLARFQGDPQAEPDAVAGEDEPLLDSPAVSAPRGASAESGLAQAPAESADPSGSEVADRRSPATAEVSR
jgi:cell division septum initiation protein DivIVA